MTAAAALLMVTAACSGGSRARPPDRSGSPTSASVPSADAATVQSGCSGAAPRDGQGGNVPAQGSIRMVSAGRGFAVVDRTIIGTADGRSWNVLYRGASQLRDVDALDARHVWAVGARTLLASDDGGAHWHAMTNGVALTMVHFTDARDGWAVGGSSLLRTSDAGRSWRALPTPCPVDRVCFDGATHGWVAARGALYETDDAGARWSQPLVVHVPGAVGGIASDLQCTPDGTAWVLYGGFGAAAGHAPYVGYRCAASGPCAPIVNESFTDPALEGIDGPGTYPGPFGVIDGHTAVFVGNTPALAHPMSMMVLTDDGRRRGAVLTIPDGTAQGASALAASFVNTERGWVLDAVSSGEHHVLATTDGGRTWTVEYRAADR